MPDTLTDLRVRSITVLDMETAPAAAAVATLIASIAASDGILTPHEFATGLSVAEAVANLTDDPAVLRSLTLRAFDAEAKPLDVAIRELATLRAAIPEKARRPLLEALFPLIATQGDQSRPLARRIGVEFGLDNIDKIITSSGLPAETGNMTVLFRRAGNVLQFGKGKLDVAAEIAQFTRDETLSRLLQGNRRERDESLNGAINSALGQLQTTIAAITRAHEHYNEQLEIATSLERSAAELEKQFKARLRSISRRIEVLRTHITEDIENLSEDGGEEAEVDLRRMSEKRGLLLRNDDRDVRERMIAKSFERRHTALKRRHDEQIQLLRDELSEFREDYIQAASNGIPPISLSTWRLVIPGATRGARVKDVLDRGASRTLASGAIAAAGTAGAIGAGWIAPAAVAGIVAAPVGAAVLGVIAVAGVWKLCANREERLRSEQRNRAEAIRQAARNKVEEAFADVTVALDDVAEGFREVSLSRLAPLRQDAERIREMCALQKELARRISTDVQHRLERWREALSQSQ